MPYIMPLNRKKEVTQAWHFLTPSLTIESGASKLILPPDHLEFCRQHQASLAPEARETDLPTDNKWLGKVLSFLVGHESPLPHQKTLGGWVALTKRSHHSNHLTRKYSSSPQARDSLPPLKSTRWPSLEELLLPFQSAQVETSGSPSSTS